MQSSPVKLKRALSAEALSLQRLEIAENSPLNGKTIKESGVRERTKGLIVGIERDGERMLNPDSSVVLLANDLLWIVGNNRRIKVLEKMVVQLPLSTEVNDVADVANN